jgi:hypothetical protein
MVKHNVKSQRRQQIKYERSAFDDSSYLVKFQM